MTLPLLPADLGGGIRAGFTGVGVEEQPFNLSTAVGDDESAVLARRARLEEWAGVPVILARQVHGASVHVCAESDSSDVAAAGARQARASGVVADALVTAVPRVAVAVLVADCVPILLADGAAGVVGAVHCGRKGLVAGVVPAAIRTMADLGARRLSAVIGPAICGTCYEVPGALQQEVADAVPGTASRTVAGTAALDLPAGVRAQLTQSGVDQVASLDLCTLEDPRWFSHRGRAAGRPSGRSAAVVRLL